MDIRVTNNHHFYLLFNPLKSYCSHTKISSARFHQCNGLYFLHFQYVMYLNLPHFCSMNWDFHVSKNCEVTPPIDSICFPLELHLIAIFYSCLLVILVCCVTQNVYSLFCSISRMFLAIYLLLRLLVPLLVFWVYLNNLHWPSCISIICSSFLGN